MALLFITIHWHWAKETIALDTTTQLAAGQMISTYEKWPTHNDLTEYQVEVVSHIKEEALNVVQLRYAVENNCGQALDNVAWGTSTIRLNEDHLSATATWANNPANVEWDATVEATVVAEDMLEDLGYAYEMRRQRRQTHFRQGLLKLGANCALSGESTVELLEAAHIVEVASTGGFGTGNGLLLRCDIHKLLDQNFFDIDPDGTLIPNDSKNLPDRYIEEFKTWALRPEEVRRISPALRARAAKRTAD